MTETPPTVQTAAVPVDTSRDENDAATPTTSTISGSTSQKELAAALAAAQGAMRPAAKSAVNPFFSTGERKAKYADLAAVWDVIREPLATNGLAVLQIPETTPTGLWLETRLLHSSGEWLAFRSYWPVAKVPPRKERGENPPPGTPWRRTPQGYGSAITYARRYSLAALLGVAAEEDDDGNAASGAGGYDPGDNPTARARAAHEAAQRAAASKSAPLDPDKAEQLWIQAKEAMDGAASPADLAALAERFKGYEGDLRSACATYYKSRMAALKTAAAGEGGAA